MTDTDNNAIAPDVRDEILRRLRAVEEQEKVRILLAVESGSRAWGFASANSDYDVRFIYVRPQEWYLSVDMEDRRDVLDDYPITDDIDLNGWDVRKALRLFANSNPGFIEWLNSPIRYRTGGSFADDARALLPVIYSRVKGIYHYRNMAQNVYRQHLAGEASVSLKKYFYALRPLLAVRWLEANRSAPPIAFTDLSHLLPADNTALVSDVDALLNAKRNSTEKSLGPMIPSIHAFIEHELARLDLFREEPIFPDGTLDRMNALFRRVVAEGAALSGD